MLRVLFSLLEADLGGEETETHHFALTGQVPIDLKRKIFSCYHPVIIPGKI